MKRRGIDGPGTTESGHTRLWAIGVRLHSGVYQSGHRRYHLVRLSDFQRESLLTWPLRCPNYGVHHSLYSVMSITSKFNSSPNGGAKQCPKSCNMRRTIQARTDKRRRIWLVVGGLAVGHSIFHWIVQSFIVTLPEIQDAFGLSAVGVGQSSVSVSSPQA